MNKTPVVPLVVSLGCLILLNASAQPSAGANSGGSTYTAADVTKLMDEAFSMGSGRPMPSMDFAGMPIAGGMCTHPRPGKHGVPTPPAKKKPNYEVPIATEQHSVVKPPHMSGLNGPTKPGDAPQLQSFLQFGQQTGWSPDKLHMAAPSQQQVKNAIARAAAVKPIMPQRSTSGMQIASRLGSTANAVSTAARTKQDAMRDRIHAILSDRKN